MEPVVQCFLPGNCSPSASSPGRELMRAWGIVAVCGSLGSHSGGDGYAVNLALQGASFVLIDRLF